MIDRENALKIVRDHVQNESLVRHMLAVEAAMRFYANRMGEDPERWGITGLLHDFDYERYPDVAADGHPNTGAPILREKGVDEEIIVAIIGVETFYGRITGNYRSLASFLHGVRRTWRFWLHRRWKRAGIHEEIP